MKTCWEVLGIEYTHDADAIRQAYLALLPSFHPESDPQGFKALRQAYESALQEAKKPAAPVVVVDANTQQINEIQEVFRDLLACDERRFQPAAWQRFIQQINTLPIKLVERLRWPLYAIAQEAYPVSYTCLRLLAERLSWERLDGGEAVDREALEDFLRDVQHGDMFDYSLLLHLPAEVQNQTIAFYAALEGAFFNHPSFFFQFINQHGVTIIPDDLQFQRRLLRWYSSLQWGIPELIPVAKAWREDEPDNSSPQYYEYTQRVYCGEGDSLFAPCGHRSRLRRWIICCCTGAARIALTTIRWWSWQLKGMSSGAARVKSWLTSTAPAPARVYCGLKPCIAGYYRH